MCYRLDQGMGRCRYFIGVDDDGRHSLLNYSTVAQSAMILECIARSLNAVVLERVMIQGECHKEEDCSNINTATPLDTSSKQDILRKYETPVFYREFHRSIQYKEFRSEDADSDSLLSDLGDTDSSESLCNDSPSISSFSSMVDLSESNHHHNKLSSTQSLQFKSVDSSRIRTFDTADGITTRCELTIQRIETHLLDTSPVSIVDLAQRKHKEIQYRERLLSNVSDGICAATEAFALLSTTQGHGTDSHSSSSPPAAESNHSSLNGSQGRSNNNSSNKSNQNHGGGNHPTQSNDPDDSSDDDSQSPSNGLTSLCETLSSRNIRVAVVGNVVCLDLLIECVFLLNSLF